MIDITILLKQAGKVVAKNSPAILTAIGVTGTISTAVFAARGAFRSVDVLKEAEEAKVEANRANPETKNDPNRFELTKAEKVSAVWTLYIPAAISAGMTIGAIICSHKISDRRAMAAAAAYTFVEKNFTEYQKKTKEKVGEKKEEAIRDEVAEENFRNRDLSRQVIVYGRGPTNCFDSWSNRPFLSDMESIRKAVNDFNCEVLKDGYGSLSQFWALLDLTPTDESDDIGWSAENPLEFRTTAVLENGEPHLCITFTTRPGPRFTDWH